MATTENTRIYLICEKDEDISAYETDARIVPVRLVPQTNYGAGEGLRLVDVSAIPADVTYVGFLTTAALRKTGLKLEHVTHPGAENTLVAYQRGGMFWSRYSYVTFAVEDHPHFATAWAWLLKELGLNPFTVPYGRRHIYDHSWLADRATAISFIAFARAAMAKLDAAPPALQMLLYTNSSKSAAMARVAASYHSILLERCIMLFCDTKKVRVI
jgi:hypothetical protein